MTKVAKVGHSAKTGPAKAEPTFFFAGRRDNHPIDPVERLWRTGPKHYSYRCANFLPKPEKSIVKPDILRLKWEN